MTQKIIFLKGLPGSGKSTWAREYCEANAKTIIVNKDTLRKELHNGVFSKKNENLVVAVQMDRTMMAIDKGMNVIIDNTHIFGNHEQDYRDIAMACNITFEIKSFLDVPLDVCLERNSKRAGLERVPDILIIKMSKSIGTSKIDIPTFPKVIQGFGENAFIFDIDGTLSYMNGRSPHDISKVLSDGVYKDIVYMLDTLSKDNRILICTGRGAECQADTEEWLKINRIKYDEIFMRPVDDRRNDAIIKYEILTNHILPKYYVRGVFDDRDRVVKMWRECGLRVYQVNYGDF